VSSFYRVKHWILFIINFGLDYMSNILITEQARTKISYQLQYEINGVVSKSLYVLNKRILCIDFNVNKVFNEILNKTKYVIQSDNQYSLAFNEIENIKCSIPAQYNPIQIKSLTEIKSNCMIDTYVTAPVGSGKTYHVLLPDIKSILESNSNNKIIVVTDLITIAEKIFENIRISLVEWEYDTEILRNYRNNAIYPNTRILVCCYDSLIKFNNFQSTHLICDEIVNISKRTYNAMKERYKLEEAQLYFFNLIRNNVCKFYDADFEPTHMDLITEQTNKKFKVYELIGYIQENKTLRLMNNGKAFRNLIDDIRSGKKLVLEQAIRN